MGRKGDILVFRKNQNVPFSPCSLADVDAEAIWLEVAEQRYQDYRAGRLPSKSADLVFEGAQSTLG
jgi:hypothetical protein